MNTASRTRHIAGALVALGFAAIAIPAHAVQMGDWLIRGGVGHVSPTGEGQSAAGKVEADSATSLTVNLAYMMTDNWGVDLLAALPFKHDIDLEGAGTVGETKQLPPTLILFYNFNPKSATRFYAGAGLNYTTFFSEKTSGALAGTDLKLDDSFGLALEAGVDIDINKDMYFNASLWWMDIDTEAEITAGGAPVVPKFDVEIDPWVLSVGVGWRF
jgi:outer membrane protein